MSKRDKQFFEVVQNLSEMKELKSEDSEVSAIYDALLKKISLENLRKLLNVVRKERAKYEALKPGQSYYIEKSQIGSDVLSEEFLYLTFLVHRNKKTEQLKIVIKTNKKRADRVISPDNKLESREKYNISKEKGSIKRGMPSFCIDFQGITNSFTLSSRGKSIRGMKKERDILAETKSPFILDYDFSEPYIKTTPEGKPEERMCMSGPQALGNAESCQIKNLTDLFVVIISVLEAVKDIHSLERVHQDLKLLNILIMKEGVARIIDFNLSEIEGKNVAVGSAGFTAPEVLAKVVENQRLKLLEVPEVKSKFEKDLKVFPKHSLSKQIEYLKKLMNYFKIIPDPRFHYCFINAANYEKNKYAISLWEEFKLPNPTIFYCERRQDIFSLCILIKQLIKKNYDFFDEENQRILIDLFTIAGEGVSRSPASRITIEQLITKVYQSCPEEITSVVIGRIQKRIQEWEEERMQSEIAPEKKEEKQSSPSKQNVTIKKENEENEEQNRPDQNPSSNQSPAFFMVKRQKTGHSPINRTFQK